MSWFSNLKVRTKLIGSFLVVAAVAAMIGGVGILSTSQINSMAKLMYEREMIGLRHAAEANEQLIAVGRAVRSTLLANTDKDYRREYSDIEDHFTEVKQELELLKTLFVTPSGQAKVADALKAVLVYEQGVKNVVTKQPSNLLERLNINEKLVKEVRPLADNADILMSQLVIEKQSNALEFSEEINAIYTNVLLLMITLTAGGALLAILLGLLITRGLTRQLGGEPKDVARAASAIAQGNLTTHIDTLKASKGSVIQAMKLMQESLLKVVSSVRDSSDHIATGSNQIAIGNADLSQRTAEQAANLTQTAAAMEELSSTVKSNAEVAQQAAQMASSASAAAVDGGNVVNNVVTTMNDINASSKKIVDIISVIDSIAFQTNILALNAAVEAARAGEQGRGFAVVASEVRSLAQKSASAAKDIKHLIDDSVQKVGNGSKMADAAGIAMHGIVTHVKRVTDLINEISAATNEQHSGLTQINDAIMQLSEVTQQNAALVEESATAADSLHDQARQLVNVVGIFNIGQNRSSVRSQAAAIIARAARVDSGESRKEDPIALQSSSKQPLPLSATNTHQSDATTPSSSHQLDAAKQSAASKVQTHAVKEEEWEEF